MHTRNQNDSPVHVIGSEADTSNVLSTCQQPWQPFYGVRLCTLYVTGCVPPLRDTAVSTVAPGLCPSNLVQLPVGFCSLLHLEFEHKLLCYCQLIETKLNNKMLYEVRSFQEDFGLYAFCLEETVAV